MDFNRMRSEMKAIKGLKVEAGVTVSGVVGMSKSTTGICGPYVQNSRKTWSMKASAPMSIFARETGSPFKSKLGRVEVGDDTARTERRESIGRPFKSHIDPSNEIIGGGGHPRS